MSRRRPLLERFWERVQKSEGCWLWQGHLKTAGYGRLATYHDDGRLKYILAHRYSWEIHNGPIPDGLLVCHHCDVRHCVRPDHLFLGTPLDSTQDMMQKGRCADRRGTKHPRAGLTEGLVLLLRKKYAGKRVPRGLGEKYGVTDTAVRFAVQGRTWKHV
jgi:hypothetical protein